MVAKIPGYQLNGFGQLEVKMSAFDAKELVKGYYKDHSQRHALTEVASISRLLCTFFGKDISIEELPPEKFGKKQPCCVLL